VCALARTQRKSELQKVVYAHSHTYWLYKYLVNCMRVRVCSRLCACTYAPVYARARMLPSMRVHVCSRLCACTYAPVYARVHARAQSHAVLTSSYIFVCVCILLHMCAAHTHGYTHARMDTSIIIHSCYPHFTLLEFCLCRVCIHVYIGVCVCVRI
jgi:hypothetical protein